MILYSLNDRVVMRINCLKVSLFFFPSPICSTSVTSAKIQVNGVHLHYQQTGEGSHAVLLLPGMLGVEIVSYLCRATTSFTIRSQARMHKTIL